MALSGDAISTCSTASLSRSRTRLVLHLVEGIQIAGHTVSHLVVVVVDVEDIDEAVP
jgi:hypothetical protein